MALTKAEIKSAQGCERYFDRHLNTANYYGKTVGIWQGGLVEKLGLEREITKEAFKRVINNLHPVTGERLTARTNTTRIEHGWELNESTRKWEWTAREVDNRDLGWDLTFSMPKSASVYYAITKDREVMRAFLETNAALVGWVHADLQVRVRVGGADFDRPSGAGLCATFLHETARPVSGETDPHVHCHNVFPNVAFDPEEQRLKAAKFREVLSNEWRYRAKAESVFAEKLLALGHGLRKTESGIDMQVITPEEVRRFSKRHQQLQEVERQLRPELERRADAAVHAAAARGEALSPDEAYAAEKAKLAREHRQTKERSKLEGEALEQDWRNQLTPGRLEQITREVSQSLACEGLMDPEEAKRHTIKHCFERQSVAKESELLIELLKVGIGRVSGEAAEAFVREDPRLAHSLAQPGKRTTREIYREDLRILEVVQEGRGQYAAMGQGKTWEIRDEKILGDAGQLGAVRHILGSRDGVTAVAGLPGTGKSTMIAETATALRELTGQAPVMLGVTASAVDTIRGKGLAARTFADFHLNRSFQESVAGRVLWVDEASLISNKDFQWLLDFAAANQCRLILSGDPQQHEAVQRGQPFKLLIDRQALKPAWLEEIYRQRNAPELKAIVEHLHAENHAEAFPRMRELGLYREAEDRAQTVAQLVEDVIAEKQAGKNPLVIAPVHRDGETYTAALRTRMRQEGLLGEQEHEMTRLKPLHLTEAQQEQWTNYEPGRVIEFHQPVAGGFQSGQQWTVVRADPEGVTVTRKGHEKVLTLDKVSGFSVYETEGMKVSVGDDLQLTKNDRRGRGRNGDVRRVKGFDGNQLVLDNGCRLDLEKAQHVRQGHTVTSQVSQSKERDKMFCLAMTSALPQVNAAQALVDVSRAQREARVYTDSVDAFEVKVQADTGHRQAAIDFLDGHDVKVSRSREQGIQVDLQEHAIQAPKKVNVVKQSVAVDEWHPGMNPPVQRHERRHGMER